MQIILTSKTTNLGEIGDIVNVKNGYARNFLIPRKKAICYTPANYKFFEAQKKKLEAEDQNNVKEAGEIKAAINKKDIIIIENASDDGRLYGSVNTNIISAEINKLLKKGQTISRSNVILEKPIKDTGVYIIKLDLHSDVSFELRLIVSRNESEVQTLLKEFENKGKKETKTKSEESDKNKKGDKEEKLEAVEVKEVKDELEKEIEEEELKKEKEVKAKTEAEINEATE